MLRRFLCKSYSIKNAPPAKNKVFKICITGGPCSGKTTITSWLKQRFNPQYMVMTVPELATMTVGSGVNIIPDYFDPEDHEYFTENMMRFQIEQENYYERIARIQEKDVILITDRGVLDPTAYCSTDIKQKILDMPDLKKADLMERYHLVLHLVTAADGAEKFYTLENNAARSESPELAIVIDDLLKVAWNGAPNHTIIDNSGAGFEEKIKRAYNTISRVVDLPEAPILTKKFLLQKVFKISNLPPESLASCEEFEEETIMMVTTVPNFRNWIKVRRYPNGNAYYSYYTRKLEEKEEERIELIRQINTNNFDAYYSQRDRNKHPVVKDVVVFIHNRTNYIVETFTKGGRRCSILRVNKHSKEDLDDWKLPEFLKILKDVSEDPNYFTHNLASGQGLY